MNEAPLKTLDQISSNKYQKDTYVIEESYQGAFIMFYYHFKQHINLKDGLLHYQKMPEYASEYTRVFNLHGCLCTIYNIYGCTNYPSTCRH